MAIIGSSEGRVIFFWVDIIVLSLSCNILLLLILYRELFCIILLVILMLIVLLPAYKQPPLNTCPQNQLVVNFCQCLYHLGCQCIRILEFNQAYRFLILIHAGNGIPLVVNGIPQASKSSLKNICIAGI